MALEGRVAVDVQVPTVSTDQSVLSGTVSRPVYGDITPLCRPRRACGVGRGDTLSIAGRVARVHGPHAARGAACIGLTVRQVAAAVSMEGLALARQRQEQGGFCPTPVMRLHTLGLLVALACGLGLFGTPHMVTAQQ